MNTHSTQIRFWLIVLLISMASIVCLSQLTLAQSPEAPAPPAPPPDQRPARTVAGKTFTSVVSTTHNMSIPPLIERFTPQEGDIVRQIAPGAYHLQRVTDDPLRINVLFFDLTAPEFSVRPAIGHDGNWLTGHTRPSFVAERENALAAVNGDLFSGD
ncbi:MAG: hypothetical protein HC837_16375, partial [Chloroflexaceae bacterium]|nr:hypothetical protein [Chloroflexaceae bacterium]